MYERLQRIINFIAEALSSQSPMEPRLILYHMARSYLGTDASPADEAPDELGCAETINAIHKRAFGHEIGGDVSTTRLYEALRNSPEWARTDEPLPGDICISPTGYGRTGRIPNGHAAYVGEGGTLMSNDSRTGTFEQNYTIASWRRYYEVKGGYPVYFFRKL